MTEYTSVIFYHNNTPKWGETVKLNLPFEMIPKVHLRFSVRHLAKSESKSLPALPLPSSPSPLSPLPLPLPLPLSSHYLIDKDKADKTFVFAFMKIMNEDGSILQDGTHELCMYKTCLLYTSDAADE